MSYAMATRPNPPGLTSGILTCAFAVLGILTIGVVFVPVALLINVIGVLQSTLGFSLSGLLVNALGLLLVLAGVVTSPALQLAALSAAEYFGFPVVDMLLAQLETAISTWL